MSFFQSAILGLVQGLTEFIPVSSSGHLILARKLLGLDLVGTISFDAVLQLATALAVVCYFWRDIKNMIVAFLNFVFKKPADDKYLKLILPLVIGTIPAIFFGLMLESYMDTYFRGINVVAGSLIAGSILFFLAEWIYRRKQSLTQVLGSPHVRPTDSVDRSVVRPDHSVEKVSVGILQGLYVGLFQCLALVPGFSRSGATISGGLIAGLSREMAARFSFLLSIPIILGSGLKKLFDIYSSGAMSTIESSLLISSIFAFISGLLAIHFLIKFLKSHSLNWFGAYRIILAIVILIFL